MSCPRCRTSLESSSLAISSANCISNLAYIGTPAGNKGMVTHSIDKCSQYIQYALQENPVESHTLIQFLVAIYGQTMNDGDDTGDSQAHEHHGTVRSPF